MAVAKRIDDITLGTKRGSPMSEKQKSKNENSSAYAFTTPEWHFRALDTLRVTERKNFSNILRDVVLWFLSYDAEAIVWRAMADACQREQDTDRKPVIGRRRLSHLAQAKHMRFFLDNDLYDRMMAIAESSPPKSLNLVDVKLKKISKSFVMRVAVEQYLMHRGVLIDT
jgi:hypothetical protein